VAKKSRLILTAAALVPLTAFAAACGSSSPSSSSSTPPSSNSSPAAAATSGKITETGSTLLFPLFGDWQAGYKSVAPGVSMTLGATGSGTGIADAASNLVNIGASDAYLSASDMTQYPSLENIPLTVAALMVNYNVPGITKPLNLNGTVLAQIYTGKITNWDDAAIKALNPGVNLTSLPIVTVRRADSSGSTFLFTSYLDAQDPSAWPSSDMGTTITWPKVSGQVAATGSGGMVTSCKSTKGCIAYIGISYLSKTTAAGLGEAALANKSGKFTQPNTATISAALSTFGTAPTTGAQPLINASTGYPVINYEYAVVNKTQSSSSEASLIKAFLNWAVTTGNTSAYLSKVGFQPLPAGTLAVTKSLINAISG
jgi:phosphate transport system substrate-binding protein